MTPVVAVLLVLVALVGTAVVLTPDPTRQAITLAVFGLCLTLLFTVLMAPDVALSQLTVGSAVVPLMVLLTVRKNRRSTLRDPGRNSGRNSGGDSGREHADEPGPGGGS